MKALYTLLILTFLSTYCKAQQGTDLNKFYITFGACFQSTNVDLKFNKRVQLNGVELTSDEATEVVLDKSIAFDGSLLRYIVLNKEASAQPLTIANNKVLLEVTSKRITKAFNIDLMKGIYIFLEECGPNKTFEIRQYKKPPILE